MPHSRWVLLALPQFVSSLAALPRGIGDEQINAALLTSCRNETFTAERCDAATAEFKKWREDFAIEYTTMGEVDDAVQVWLPRFNEVVENNAAFAEGSVTYSLRLTQYADRPDEDELIKRTGLREADMPLEWEPQREFPPNNAADARDRERKLRKLSATSPADREASSADWRPWLSQVENQAPCQSCWAFTTSAVVEGAFHLAEAKKNGMDGYPLDSLTEYGSLSEQQLMDCNAGWEESDGGTTCALGGSVVKALASISKKGKMGGVSLRVDQPYLRKNGECDPSDKKRTLSCTLPNGRKADGCLSKISNPYLCPRASSLTPSAYTDKLMEMLEYAPVAIALYSCALPAGYASGIVTKSSYSQSCANSRVDLAVTLVGWGYDADLDLDYWTIRNSWGQQWGESGHVRLERTEDIAGIQQNDPCIPLGPQEY